MLMRVFFLAMSGYIASDFYKYSVENHSSWIQYKYYIVFGICFFAMLMLTRDNKFTF